MKKGIQKILAICTVLTLVLSALAGTLGASATTAGDFEVTQVTGVPLAANLLADKTGKFCWFDDESGELKEIENANSEYTDGNSGGGGFNFVTDEQPFRHKNTYLIYDLGASYTISNVLLLARSSNYDYHVYPLAYNVRIADTREGLLEETALKVSYDNAEKKIGQYFTFKNEIPTGQYIAFEFPADCLCSPVAACSLRLGEVGAYSEPTSVFCTNQDELPVGANLLTGKTGEFWTINDSKELTKKFDIDKMFTDDDAEGTSYDVGDEATHTTYLVYDLGDNYDITNTLMLGRTTDNANYPLEYKVHIADTKDAVFEESTVKVHYDNKKKNKGQYLTFEDEIPSGRYIAFEFPAGKICTNGSYWLRIGEVGAYRYSATFSKRPTASDSDILAGKESRIKDKVYEAFNVNGNPVTIDQSNHKPGDFTDGDIATGGYFDYDYNNGNPVFVYDLGGVYSIDKVLLMSRSANDELKTAKYCIRVADTKEALFTNDARVLYYDNRSHIVDGKTLQSQLLEFSANCPTARYIGFEIIQPNTQGNGMVRIGELAVYGEKLKYNYNEDKAVDILDLIRLKKYTVGDTTDIDLTVKGENDPADAAAAALVELKKFLLG